MAELPPEDRDRLAEVLWRDRDVNLPMDDALDVSITDVVRALAPVVASMLADAEARAWDEGRNSLALDFMQPPEAETGRRAMTRNPYRAHASVTAVPQPEEN